MPTNVRELFLDCEILDEKELFNNSLGLSPIIRSLKQRLFFNLKYSENGTKIWERKWSAMLSEWENEDIERLTTNILTQLNQRPKIDIWDSKPVINKNCGWISKANFSVKAHEIFAFLRQPLQKWLESYAGVDYTANK